MKGSSRALLGIIIFMGIILLFSTTLLNGSRQPGFLNSTSNGTTISILSNSTGGFATGTEQTSICYIAPSSPNPYDFGTIVTNLFNSIPLLNCITGFGNFLWSFQGFSSSVGWLQTIIYACIVVLIYLASGLFRGGK